MRKMIGYASKLDMSPRDMFKNDKLFQALKVLKESNMILFRGTEVSRQELMNIAQVVGDPAKPKATYRNTKDILTVISTNPKEGDSKIGQKGWHADGGFQENMFRYVFLYMRDNCPGKNTIFVKNEYVFDAIPSTRKEFWKDALISNTRSYDRMYIDDAPYMKIFSYDEEDLQIRFHQHYTRSFKDGKTGEEFVAERKDELIEEFASYIEEGFKKNGYRHEYEDHDLILYKNTSMMHNFELQAEKYVEKTRTLERMSIQDFHLELKKELSI